MDYVAGIINDIPASLSLGKIPIKSSRVSRMYAFRTTLILLSDSDLYMGCEWVGCGLFVAFIEAFCSQY